MRIIILSWQNCVRIICESVFESACRPAWHRADADRHWCLILAALWAQPHAALLWFEHRGPLPPEGQILGGIFLKSILCIGSPWKGKSLLALSRCCHPPLRPDTYQESKRPGTGKSGPHFHSGPHWAEDWLLFDSPLCPRCKMRVEKREHYLDLEEKAQ